MMILWVFSDSGNNLARKAQHEVIRGSKKLPLHYTLGTGHVLFFYNKLGFISKRYVELTRSCDVGVTPQIRFPGKAGRMC